MRPSRRLVLAAAWVAALAGFTIWLSATPNLLLREQLKSLQFWSLEACLVAALIVGIAALKELARGFGRIDLRLVAAPAALGLALTLFVADRTNRIYYDEQIYQSVGQNLADLKRAQICNDGTVEYGRLQCAYGEYNKQPYGYPHLLSLVYRLTGVGDSAAFFVNALVMALTIASVYLLAVLLFTDRTPAFFAALLVALTPEQIIWSATAAVEPSAALAMVVALVFAAWARRSDTAVSLAAAAAALGYAVQFRPESVLVVPICLFLLARRIRAEWTRERFWWIALLLFALVAVHLAHLYAVRNVEWGTSDARFSLRYVPGNLRVNGPFFLGDERFPVIFTALAVFGLVGRRFLVERFAVALYFLVFWGICLLFYAGSYNYGADVRYSVLTVAPVAILGGLGAARLTSWLEQRSPVRGRLAVSAALLFQFLWYAPLVRATTEEAWAARADVRFARQVAAELPRDAYVLTHNPGMFHVWGVNAGQLSAAATNPSYLDHLATRFRGGVYVHWNFWCNVHDPIQPEFCRRVLQLKPFEVAREYHERDQRFAFYRLE